MNRRSYATVFLAFAFVTLLVVAGCSRESSQKQAVQSTSESGSSTAPSSSTVGKQDKALVRVVHALPGGKAVDVLANETVVFSDLGYKSVTPYRELPDDRFTFRIRPAGDTAGKALAENSQGLAGGNHYSLVAVRKADGSADLLALSDNLTPPSQGKAKVRVIHAALDAGDVDVFAVGQDKALFDGVDAGSETFYNEVDPMTVTLQVRPQGKKTTLLNVKGVAFEAGKIYTIVVTGRAKGSPRLEAIQIEDQFLGAAGQRSGY